MPHDRCDPYSNLESNTYYLSKIPEKHDDGTGNIAHSQDQEEHAEGKIRKLNPVYGGIVSTDDQKNAGHKRKEQVYEQRTDDLYYGKDTYLKYHLFYKELV